MTRFHVLPETDTICHRLQPNVSAIPMITVLKVDAILSIPNGISPDKFAVAYSEMTAELATRPTGTCWMVFVRDSGRNPGLGLPFGFFKMNSQKNTIHLHIFPYDVKNFFTVFGQSRASLRLDSSLTALVSISRLLPIGPNQSVQKVGRRIPELPHVHSCLRMAAHSEPFKESGTGQTVSRSTLEAAFGPTVAPSCRADKERCEIILGWSGCGNGLGCARN